MEEFSSSSNYHENVYAGDGDDSYSEDGPWSHNQDIPPEDGDLDGPYEESDPEKSFFENKSEVTAGSGNENDYRGELDMDGLGAEEKEPQGDGDDFNSEDGPWSPDQDIPPEDGDLDGPYEESDPEKTFFENTSEVIADACNENDYNGELDMDGHDEEEKEPQGDGDDSNSEDGPWSPNQDIPPEDGDLDGPYEESDPQKTFFENMSEVTAGAHNENDYHGELQMYGHDEEEKEQEVFGEMEDFRSSSNYHENVYAGGGNDSSSKVGSWSSYQNTPPEDVHLDGHYEQGDAEESFFKNVIAVGQNKHEYHSESYMDGHNEEEKEPTQHNGLYSEKKSKVYIMSHGQLDLSPGQLHKLADLIHRQEVEKLTELNFNSYLEQQKYLNDSKDARDRVFHILESAEGMMRRAEAKKDATKKGIAKDVFEYCTIGIETSLKFIRSYNTRLTYLDKLKTHSDSLIEKLKWLDPSTQQKDAQRLALEAGMYKKATLENAKKFQAIVPNKLSEWLKDNKIKFEDLVQRNMAKLGFSGPFKNLDDIQKLQVYENIIADAGKGKSVVTYSFEALGKVGVAFLVFTAAAMVWDIYTSEDKLQAAVRDSVNVLTEVVGLKIGAVVDAAIEAGFVALDIEIASAAVTVIGAVVGFGISALIGMAAGALLDLIFSSGTSKVQITDGLSVCRVAPMPDGLEIARLVKHKYPNL